MKELIGWIGLGVLLPLIIIVNIYIARNKGKGRSTEALEKALSCSRILLDGLIIFIGISSYIQDTLDLGGCFLLVVIGLWSLVMEINKNYRI